MKLCPTFSACASALALAIAARAAETPKETAVELPPMLIEESNALPPWLYARGGDAEYLSRCNERTTRGYAEMRRDRLVWLHTLFPAELFARMDAPLVTLLVSQRFKPSSSAEVIDEVLDPRRRMARGGYVRATTAPNMMLNDADVVGVFAYIDENSFRGTELTISSDFVRFLLECQTPLAPHWLREGVLANYNSVLFTEEPITLRPLTWPTVRETLAQAANTPGASGAAAQTPREVSTAAALARLADGPRVLLAAGELFSRDGPWTSHPQLARAQAALLVRWAIDPRNGVREKFWAFALQACVEPVTEAKFEAALGFGFADLRDRLSDYLPTAVREPLVIPLPKPPRDPVEVRLATPTEIARLRGEWERLSVPLVRRRYPEHVERYRAQAIRTLQKAYDVGERDPRLVASLALCELDAGSDVVATPLLERAAAQGVVRPRVYFELARLRWAALTRGANAPREFEADDVAPVLQPLRQGLRQQPVLSAAAELFADALMRSKAPPSDADFAELVRLGRLFVTDPVVCLRCARALGRHGRTEPALQVLNAGFPHVTDEATRKQFAQLYAAFSRRAP